MTIIWTCPKCGTLNKWPYLVKCDECGTPMPEMPANVGLSGVADAHWHAVEKAMERDEEGR